MIIHLVSKINPALLLYLFLLAWPAAIVRAFLSRLFAEISAYSYSLLISEAVPLRLSLRYWGVGCWSMHSLRACTTFVNGSVAALKDSSLNLTLQYSSHKYMPMIFTNQSSTVHLIITTISKSTTPTILVRIDFSKDRIIWSIDSHIIKVNVQFAYSPTSQTSQWFDFSADISSIRTVL